MDLLDSRLDRYEEALGTLQVRDDDIYRSVFGMNEIPAEVRSAGAGGVDKYAYLDGLEGDARLKNTLVRLDRLSRMAYVQSKSLDEVAALSRKAGDMASCIPAIPPLMTDPSTYRLSSPFGYRSDPLNGSMKLHTGMDFACKPGNSVYATGDGVVETVRFELFGYGNSIIIDHGFGYKTRYAHLDRMTVIEGMKVKRGDKIGDSGQSGRASGPHLHYEVFYKGERVNPMNYFDLSMSKQEYMAMVNKRAEESGTTPTRRSFSVTRR
jgi:murein DD-endopeptidase MepM/ murein hydrolase activator NlpD